MIPAKLQDLIKKFYAGETTEHEEEQLRAYFDIAEVSDELAKEKEYFLSMTALKKEKLSDSFDTDLFMKIDSEKTAKTYSIWRYSFSGVAATIAIFLVVWFGTDVLKPNTVYGTINDPHLAFSETQKVLDEVSKKINKGLKPAKATVDKVEENVRKTSDVKKINKALNKTKSIHKIEEASELLKSFSKVTVDYGKS